MLVVSDRGGGGGSAGKLGVVELAGVTKGTAVVQEVALAGQRGLPAGAGTSRVLQRLPLLRPTPVPAASLPACPRCCPNKHKTPSQLSPPHVLQIVGAGGLGRAQRQSQAVELHARRLVVRVFELAAAGQTSRQEEGRVAASAGAGEQRRATGRSRAAASPVLRSALRALARQQHPSAHRSPQAQVPVLRKNAQAWRSPLLLRPPALPVLLMLPPLPGGGSMRGPTDRLLLLMLAALPAAARAAAAAAAAISGERGEPLTPFSAPPAAAGSGGGCSDVAGEPDSEPGMPVERAQPCDMPGGETLTGTATDVAAATGRTM